MRTLSLALLVACGGGKTEPGATTDTSTAGAGLETGGGGGGGGGGVPCVDDDYTPIVPVREYPQFDFQGFPAFHSIPDDPKAVVFVLHGSGGEISNLIGQHYVRIYNAWNNAGIAMVATESTNRSAGTWDSSELDPERNADMPRIAALRADLIDQGLLAEDTPVFAWGFSNGGSHTEEFALMAQDLGWPMRGILVHDAPTSRGLELPAFFTSAENDDVTSSAKASYENWKDRGLPAEWMLTKERPWIVEEALLHPAYDVEMAQDVFDELVEFGLIDSSGARLASLEGLEGTMRALERNSAVPGAARITSLIRVVWATHRPTSEPACEETAFIEAHL